MGLTDVPVDRGGTGLTSMVAKGAIPVATDAVTMVAFQVGANDFLPVADSSQTAGMRWDNQIKIGALGIAVAAAAWSSSWVNGLQLSGSLTGNAPTITASGTNANIGINLVTKGAAVAAITGGLTVSGDTTLSGALSVGALTVTAPATGTVAETINGFSSGQTANLLTLKQNSGGAALFGFGTVASAVNGVNFSAVATGGSPLVAAAGTDTNIDLTLAAQGIGSMVVKSPVSIPVEADLTTLTGGAVNLIIDATHNEVIGLDCTNNRIVVFSRTNTGNVAPLRVISGASTTLLCTTASNDTAGGIALDLVNDELIVSNGSGQSIIVFNRTDNGNVAPKRTISGASTTLGVLLHHVAVDPVNDEIIVVDRTNLAVLAFSRTANGNVAPLRTITGASTLFTGVRGVYVDTVNNEIGTSNFGDNGRIMVFLRTDNGNVAPQRNWTTGIFGGQLYIDTVNDEIGIGNPYATNFIGTVWDRSTGTKKRTLIYTGFSGASFAIAVDTTNNEIAIATDEDNAIVFLPRTWTQTPSAGTRTILSALRSISPVQTYLQIGKAFSVFNYGPNSVNGIQVRVDGYYNQVGNPSIYATGPDNTYVDLALFPQGLDAGGSGKLKFNGPIVTIFHSPNNPNSVGFSGPAAAATSGVLAAFGATTFTNNSTAGSGTAAAFSAFSFSRPTLGALNTLVTTTDAATVYIENDVSPTTNMTITNRWALWVGAGATQVQALTAKGTVSIGTVGTINANSTHFHQTALTGRLDWSVTAYSGTPGTTGSMGNFGVGTFTDSNTAGSGTAAIATGYTFSQPTFAATNSLVTTTDAATVYIANAPANGTNNTITNKWAILVAAGNCKFAGAVTMAGALSGVTTIAVSSTATFSGTVAITTVGQILASGVNIRYSALTGRHDFLVTAWSGTPGTSGSMCAIGGATFTDSNTAGSGTAALFTGTSIATPTLAATNSLVTTTDAATFYIVNSPTASTNQTITNKWAILVAAGNCKFAGAVTMAGALSGVTTIAASGVATLSDTTGSTITFGTVGKIGTTSTSVLFNALTGRFQFTTTAYSASPGGATGNILNIGSITFTDSGTAGSGTAALWTGVAIARCTLDATNSTVTTTDAASLYVANAPNATGNQTITNAWSILVSSGACKFNGAMTVTGTATMAAATFSGTTSYSTVGQILASGVNFRYSALTGRHDFLITAWSGTPGASGAMLAIGAATFTDSNTAGSGTAALATGTSIAAPTFAATNSTVTTTDAATFYVAAAPTVGTNQTFTNSWAILVASGATKLQALTCAGALTCNTTSTFTGVATFTATPVFNSDININTVGKGLQIKGGTNGRISASGGNALVAGTVTVSNTSIAAADIILWAVKTDGGTVGNVSYTINAGVGFTFTSTNVLDTSTIVWVLLKVN